MIEIQNILRNNRKLFGSLGIMLILILTLAIPVLAATVPTGLTATPYDDWVSLDWDDTVDGNYNVYMSTDGGTTFNIINDTYITQSSTSVTGLTPETAYQFTVSSWDGTAESAQSAPVSVTTTAEATPSGFFGEMLDLVIDALPWIIILMLFGRLMRKA